MTQRLSLDEFWGLIEKTHKASEGNAQRQVDLLIDELSSLSVEEIIEFDTKLHEVVDRAYIADLWNAAYIVGCGWCSDDGFLYFRAWLIGQGQKVYEKALMDPEILADIVNVGQETQMEFLLYVAQEAYERITFEEEIPIAHRASVKLSGTLAQSEQELWNCFPKLTQKFRKACEEIDY